MTQDGKGLLSKKRLAFVATIVSALSIAIYAVYLTFANSAPEGTDFIGESLKQADPVVLTPQDHVRPADQTFLTFPEWFLVHSPREYAEFLVGGRPSEFPFFRHIGQFWQSYRQVGGIANKYFAFNTEYHIMIMVIGVSTTAEYGIKAVYETLIGRLFETLSYESEEDRFLAREAADYVAFIDVDPWYKFNFSKYLKELWFSGPTISGLRSLERRYLITSELAVKSVYGWLIGLGTAASFEAPIPQTALIIKKTDQLDWNGLGIKPPTDIDNDHVLAFLPRYQAFTPASIALAKGGVQFVEVAGNRGPILISILAPEEWRPRTTDYDVVFSQPMITKNRQKRVVVVSLVKNLGQNLVELSKAPLVVEHVYDF